MKITILTATYNRCDLLHRLFQSLLAQRYENMEWIIIDDGGNDGSAESIQGFRSRARFDIRYVHQENEGKHHAINNGLDLITGDAFCIVDDDDYFLPDVFSRVAADFATIVDHENVASLSYLSEDPAGKLRGKRFPRDRMISDHFECRFNQGIAGDKCEFTKASAVTNDHIRFVVSPTKGGFGGDDLFFFQIAEKYQTCYINSTVLVKDYRDDGISVNWRRKALENPALSANYYAAHLNPRLSLAIRFKYMVAHAAIRTYSQQSIARPELDSIANRLLFCLSELPGRAIGFRWRRYKHGDHPLTRKYLPTRL